MRRKLSPILMGVDEGAEMSEDKLVESAVFKMVGFKSFFDIISPLVREGRYRDLYYLLKCMKLMEGLLQPLMFTQEERKVADKAIQQFVQILTEAMNLKRQPET